MRATLDLGDPGDFYIRPEKHGRVALVFRESDHAGVTVQTTAAVLESLLACIADAVDAETPPLPFEHVEPIDPCDGGSLPHRADVVALSPDALRLATGQRRPDRTPEDAA